VSDEDLAIGSTSATPAWAQLPTAGWQPQGGAVPRRSGGSDTGPASSVPASPDPEKLLTEYRWRFDPETLREVLDERDAGLFHAVRGGLTAKLNAVSDNAARARLLSLRAVVARVLGDLHRAMSDGKLALAHAEATGELRRIAIAQARLAHVLQWTGEYAAADRLFALANSTELPDRLRAMMHQHAGKCAYDQGRYIEACNHFERALDLRHEEDPELIASTEMALDAVFRQVAAGGWGPYPRTPEEILQVRKPPVPAYDDYRERWGYAGEDGGFEIPPAFDDAQPFRDGVAWVQLPGARTWALIDEAGGLLIQPAAGYLGVSSFADGLAWVSRDGATGWVAIDRDNRMVIPGGFEDVRPFRRGLAAVRHRGWWGAVDQTGRMVVPFEYEGFATALYDGRYIDGFSDEGLAVVVRDGRRGVVDRNGRVVVPAVYAALMIHPVAFLVVDGAQQWGALDRRGRLLVDPSYPSRLGVVAELDRLLADTRPIL
jgi:tetratricopeptide (TPR) repeat protein